MGLVGALGRRLLEQCQHRIALSIQFIYHVTACNLTRKAGSCRTVYRVQNRDSARKTKTSFVNTKLA
jgi:hypothetical protein